jgi:serine/threonine-protein kinase RsbT
VSRINARVVVERGCRVLGHPDRIAEHERVRLLVALRTSAALFVSSEKMLSDLEAALQHIVGDGGSSLRARDIPIRSEEDLRTARTVAREMAVALRAGSLSAQRIATAVSELARNIVAYTPGGNIRLEPLDKRLRIVADDRGNGIANLDEVLGGTYRSKTGLGRGLAGVRRLMDSFDIQTGPRGTRITVEAPL